MATFGSLGARIAGGNSSDCDQLGWSYALDFAALVTMISGLAWFFTTPSHD